MSLDKVQSKDGVISIGATITAGGFPGGVDIAYGSGFAAGLVSATDGGGAFYARPMPFDALAQTLAASGTITHNGAGCVMLTTGGAVTGIVMQAGVRDGQHLALVNTSANSITFNATQSVSLVASSVEVIAANRATLMTWNAIANRWFRVNV